MLDPEETLYWLKANAVALDQLEAPAQPGVYGIFLNQGAGVPGIAQPRGEPIYVGTSGNLAQREFDTHFAAGQSGFSTLRRSLGALLLDQLGLRPRPRGTGSSRTDFQNYRFDDVGEQGLSEWMTMNLLVGIHAASDPATIEKELIHLARPPLNLTHWTNPDAPAIKAARKACAERARLARR